MENVEVMYFKILSRNLWDILTVPVVVYDLRIVICDTVYMTSVTCGCCDAM